MGKESDEILKANQGGPAADIPDLKKKEKERKKGGAAWGGARGGSGSFGGATGGTVARAAASAAVGAVEAAEVGEAGGLFASLSEFLAGLMATLGGKIALAAAALLIMGGLGALASYLLKGGGDAAMGHGDLGAISDSLKIRSGTGDMMGVNSKGELGYGANPTAPPPTTDAKPTDAKAADKVADKPADGAKDDAAAGWAPPQGLAHNLSGAQLSSSLGGDFGGKNIFGGAGNSNAPKFNAGLSQMNMPKVGSKAGTIGSLAAKSTRGSASGMDIMRARSGQAIAQLKMSRGMSAVGAGAPTAEGAASAANGAFDQQAVDGGGLNTIGGPGIGSTPSNPSSGGAPDTTSMPTAPSTPTGTATDPNLQNAMNQIQSMAQQAAQLQSEGMMMIVAGAALVAIGAAIGWPWGAVLIGIGAMLIGIGVMMEMMAKMLGNMAKQMGSMVAGEVGQYQGNIVNDCVNQSLTGNTSPCNSSSAAQANANGNAADATSQAQQSTVGTATPTLSNTGGSTTNGGTVSGSGGSAQH